MQFKIAQDQVIPPAYPPLSSSSLHRWDAADAILSMLGGGVMAGALGRSALGLRDMITQNSKPYAAGNLSNPIPIVEDPVEAVKPKEQRKKRKRKKSANELPPVDQDIPFPGFHPQKQYGPLRGQAVGAVRKLLGLNTGDGLLSGVKPTSWKNVPATWAVGVPLAAAAAYGGFQGVDALADWRRLRERDSEIEEAKRIYQEELAALSEKKANDPNFKVLDEMEDALTQLEKQGTSLNDLQNGLLSLYLPLAGLSFMGGGILGHNYGKKRSERELIEKAMRRRSKRRMHGMHSLGTPDSFYLDESL